jgi:hypothetical protein
MQARVCFASKPAPVSVPPHGIVDYLSDEHIVGATALLRAAFDFSHNGRFKKL